MGSQRSSDIARIEQLWSGTFGNAYIERNRTAGDARGPFWGQLLAEFQIARVLEIGCNTGANLRWLTGVVSEVYGADVSAPALMELHRVLPGVKGVLATGRDLPFRDEWFDLTFTMGVLIHQSPDALPLVMREIVRCSRRYVLCGEYYADEPTEVPYRGQQGALFKRDFGGLYQNLCPELTLRATGFLSRDQGWDDVTWWMFEKVRP